MLDGYLLAFIKIIYFIDSVKYALNGYKFS